MFRTADLEEEQIQKSEKENKPSKMELRELIEGDIEVKRSLL
jgi:hypothetical protein